MQVRVAKVVCEQHLWAEVVQEVKGREQGVKGRVQREGHVRWREDAGVMGGRGVWRRTHLQVQVEPRLRQERAPAAAAEALDTAG